MHFKSRLSLIAYFLKGSAGFFILSIIFSGLCTLSDMINPKIIQYTVDHILTDSSSDAPRIVTYLIDKAGGATYLAHHLHIIALTVVLVALSSAVNRYFVKLTMAVGAERLTKKMRDDLYEHIIRLPFKWHNENHTGDILQRCTSDVDVIKNFLSEQLVNLFRISILIVMSLIFMFRIDIRLSLISASLIPIIIFYCYIFHERIADSFLHVDTMEGKVSSMVQENLTGVRVVRAFGRERYEKDRFEKKNEEYMNTWIRLMKLLSMFWASGDFMSGLQVMLIVFLGGVFAVKGSLSVGEYIAFISYNAMLTWPVRYLGRVISDMSKSGVSVDRLKYIMNSEEEENRNTLTPAMNKDIVFDHVSFSYEGSDIDVINDVSFTIPAGATVGIIGRTGSGKSTLMYLLERLINIKSTQGRITIGGVDINDIDIEYLRKNIGMVLQEPFLFSRTLSENIAITEDELSMAKVKEAAKTAMLDDTVNKFSKGYDTFVGERGVTLSGGQKQRTAIAQMLIKKPPIMIFDDSLSAVDAETDAAIRSRLGENIKDSTVIIIAHRISTLMNADMIFVMDKGKIVERGTHTELIALGGQYKKIYDLQNPKEA